MTETTGYMNLKVNTGLSTIETSSPVRTTPRTAASPQKIHDAFAASCFLLRMQMTAAASVQRNIAYEYHLFPERKKYLTMSLSPGISVIQ